MPQLIKDHHKEHTSVYYLVRTKCVNLLGEQVDAYVGMVRGMTDAGHPGWVEHPDTYFTSLLEAQAAVRFPTSLNCYGREYVGAPIDFIMVTTHIQTNTKWQLLT